MSAAESPRPWPRTARELAAKLAAERSGSPFLLFRDGDDRQQIAVLGPGQTHLTIGRDDANDVALSWDEEVSRAHAELELLAGQWAVADDGLSRNGTFVNGRLIQGRRRLRDGDLVRLGQTVLLYASHKDVGSATVAASATPLLEQLTPIQRRILAALCRPLMEAGGVAPPATNQEIADAVHLSVEGVKGQLRTLADRFGIGDLPQNRKRLELAARALGMGLGAPAGE